MVLALATAVLAAPLNPWGSATAPGAALVNPYLYVYPEALNPILYGSAGLAEGVDLYFGYGQYIPQGAAGVGTLEVFPRFFVVPQVALVPHLYWSPGVDGVVAAPEVHVNVSAGRLSLVANAGWRPIFSADGFSAGSVPVLVAPEVRLGQLSVWIEVDPTLSLVGDPVALLVVPGFGITLDAAAQHAVSVGLQVPVLPAAAPASLGFWYCFTLPAPEKG